MMLKRIVVVNAMVVDKLTWLFAHHDVAAHD